MVNMDETRQPYRLALVTGGAGFIGSHLVDALVKSGVAVRVVDNLSTGHLRNLAHVMDGIEFFEADIEDIATMEKITQGCDVIFHQAAMVSVPQTVKQPLKSAMVNEIGTLNILEVARKNGVKRVVMASSCAVYGDAPGLPKKENMGLNPLSPYAVQKLTGEYYAGLYATLYGVETVCLRYFNVYGPRQDPSSPYSGVISIFMQKALEGSVPVIYGDGNQYRDFVFVKDVVRANLLGASADIAHGLICNIGTGKTIMINGLWDKIRALAHSDIHPVHQQAREGDVRESMADIGRANEALSFQPAYSFDTGIEETFAWYRESMDAG